MNPPTPVPAARVRPPRPGRINYREVLLRVGLVLVVVGAVALMWWSYRRLVPLQQRTRELNATVTRLSSEVDEMQRRWSGADIEQLNQKSDRVQAQLFSGPPELEAWLRELKEQVVPLALDINANFGKTSAAAPEDQKLATVPATVSVEVKPAPGIPGVQTPYQRILQLSQRLTAQEKRADLVELSVAGGTNSVSRAVVVLNLWAGQEGQQ